jgi:hypothetical protein
MAKNSTGRTDEGHYMRLGVLLLAVLALIVFLAVRATVETPSGEGVPGPADWARHGQSQWGP